MSAVWEKVARWTGEERIGELLLAHYGLRLEGAVPVGGVLKIDTNRGTFALKRAGEGGESHWRGVAEVGRHLLAAEAGRIPVPIRTRSGGHTFAGYVQSYVLLPWILGKPVSYTRLKDFRDTSRGLARLHAGTRGFRPSSFRLRVSWPRTWERAIDRIGLYRVAVDWSGSAGEADAAFRDAAPYAEGMAENALRYLHRSGVDPQAPEIASRGLVCHGNLHGGNLLRDERGAVRFIDWNRMAWDARARDVAQWLLYAYGRTGDLDLLAVLLTEYQRADRLMEEELCLIYALFLYPHRLMRVLDRIYGEQSLSPDRALFHLAQAVAVEEKKLPLLRRFPDLVEGTLGWKIPRVDWLERRI
ncbi:MAG: phosphotransferase [Planifilum fimeticola]